MFWNHLDISFPLSTGILFQIQIGFEVAYFDKSTMQVDNFEPVFLSFSLSQWQSFSAITSVLSETPFLSWYQANYSNIRICCIIRIFKYWFPKKEYYSLFLFIQLLFPNIIHYSYSSYFHYSLQHCQVPKSQIRIRTYIS